MVGGVNEQYVCTYKKLWLQKTVINDTNNDIYHSETTLYLKKRALLLYTTFCGQWKPSSLRYKKAKYYTWTTKDKLAASPRTKSIRWKLKSVKNLN